MDKGKSLLNITFLSTLSRMVFYVFVFLTSFITSRALSKAEFGELQYIMLLTNIGWILFNLGVPNLLSRYFTQAFGQKSIPIVYRLLRMAIVAGAITFVLTNTLLKVVHPETIAIIPDWVLWFLVFITLCLFYLQILAQALFAYAYIFITNLVACSTALLFLIWGLPVLGGVAFLYSYMIVNGILAIGYAIILSKGLFNLKQTEQDSNYVLPESKSLLKSAVYFGGSAIFAGFLWQRYELSFLKAYVPFAEMANYMIAFSVMALLVEPLKLIPSALIYYFASISNDHTKASEKFEKFYRHFSWLVLFAGIFVFFNALPIVTAIYTDKYTESAALLQFLLIGMIPGTTSYVMMNMHVGLGRSKFLVTQDIIGVVVFASLLFVGVNSYGLAGAALAKSTTILASVSLGLWYTAVHLKYKVPYLQLGLMLVLSVVLCGFTGLWFTESIVQIGIKGVVLFLIYLFVSWALHIIDRDLVKDTLSRGRQFFKPKG